MQYNVFGRGKYDWIYFALANTRGLANQCNQMQNPLVGGSAYFQSRHVKYDMST